MLSCALIHLISPGAAPTVTRLSKAPQVTEMWENLLTVVLPTFSVLHLFKKFLLLQLDKFLMLSDLSTFLIHVSKLNFESFLFFFRT